MAVDTRSMIEVEPVVISYDSLHLYGLEDLRDEERRLEIDLARNPGDGDAATKLKAIRRQISTYSVNGGAK